MMVLQTIVKLQMVHKSWVVFCLSMVLYALELSISFFLYVHCLVFNFLLKIVKLVCLLPSLLSANCVYLCF
uniref:Uncharacterized protein n=1 Tax=Rhizophora mucronata TaxID=61149 RepID=A0A2P2LS89_RHIMU